MTLEHSSSFGPSSLASASPAYPVLLRPLLTSRSDSSPSPFQARGEIFPGQDAILAQPPDLQHLILDRGLASRACWPSNSAPPSPGSCPSARGFAPRSLPRSSPLTPVALVQVRCGQLTGGLRSVPPMLGAHEKKPTSSLTPAFFLNLTKQADKPDSVHASRPKA